MSLIPHCIPFTVGFSIFLSSPFLLPPTSSLFPSSQREREGDKPSIYGTDSFFFPRSCLFKDSILVTWIPPPMEKKRKKKNLMENLCWARLIPVIPIFQGYTPLHIAMQFDHENIFNLLVQVYGEWNKLS